MNPGAKPQRESLLEGIPLENSLSFRQQEELGVRTDALVFAPRTEAGFARLFEHARSCRQSILPIGAGTCLDFGPPPSKVDTVLSTGKYTGGSEHSAADFVVTVKSGTKLEDLQQQLHSKGQWLPIEPPDPDRATLGGLINTAAPSLLAASFGTLRASLLGTKVMLANGEITHAGGRVVKNVSGYDLMKLYHGSLGVFAVLLEATLRLRPLPETDVCLSLSLPRPADALEVAARLWNELPLEPAAILVHCRGADTLLLVRLLGSANAVETLCSEIQRVSAHRAWTRADQAPGRPAPVWQQAIETLGTKPRNGPPAANSAAPTARTPASPARKPAGDGVLGLSVHTVRSQLQSSLASLEKLLTAPPASLLIDCLLGTVFARYDEAAANNWDAELGSLRRELGSAAVVLRSGSAELRRRVPPLAMNPGEEQLLFRLKTMFDPANLLCTGRLPGMEGGP